MFTIKDLPNAKIFLTWTEEYMENNHFTTGKADTLSFIHVTDIHICNLAGYHPYFIERLQNYGQGIEPLKEFFRSLPKTVGSDFALITRSFTRDSIYWRQIKLADKVLLYLFIEIPDNIML